jgi:hypothetical protein
MRDDDYNATAIPPSNGCLILLMGVHYYSFEKNCRNKIQALGQRLKLRASIHLHVVAIILSGSIGTHSSHPLGRTAFP